LFKSPGKEAIAPKNPEAWAPKAVQFVNVAFKEVGSQQVVFKSVHIVFTLYSYVGTVFNPNLAAIGHVPVRLIAFAEVDALAEVDAFAEPPTLKFPDKLPPALTFTAAVADPPAATETAGLAATAAAGLAATPTAGDAVADTVGVATVADAAGWADADTDATGAWALTSTLAHTMMDNN